MNISLIEGKKIANAMLDRLANEVATLTAHAKRNPGLAVVLVGNDEASKIYVKIKIGTCQKIGIKSTLIHLNSDVAEEELCNTIRTLNVDDTVDGILIQLPLPQHINTSKVLECINPNKDVDGFNPINIGNICYGTEKFLPCTPAAILQIIFSIHQDVVSKNIVIINNTIVVGKPLSMKLSYFGATVTVCDKNTTDLAYYTKNADIIVVAAGVIGLINDTHCKLGVTIIDVGINRRLDGTIIGDVDFDRVRNVASFVTPVPGGVGPLTVAWLMQNTLKAYTLNNL